MNGHLFCIAVLIGAIAAFVTAELDENIPIGSLFHNSDNETRDAYYIAALDINLNEAILPDNKLAIRVQEVNDIFSSGLYVCDMLSDGVAAILGPSGPYVASYVESILDHKEVPHLIGRWDDRPKASSFQVNLHPSPEGLLQALVSLIRDLEWPAFTLLFDDDTALKRVSMLLKKYDSRGPKITVRQLPPPPIYRSLFQELKYMGQTRFLLECSVDILFEVLKQLQQVGMMSSQYSYIITSLDLWTVNLEPFQHGGTNITGFRLVNPDDQETKDVALQLPITPYVGRVPNTIRLEAALMYDSVKLLASSLASFMHPLLALKRLKCDDLDSWEHGSSFINHIRTSEIKGLTGNIHFDNQGLRSEFDLDIVELGEEGLRTIGLWRPTDDINVTRFPSMQNIPRQQTSYNRTLIVLIALSKPFGMLKEETARLSGNDRFEGYAIDMIHELSVMLNFNYTFKLHPDNDYGSYNTTTEQWTGMMKELLDKRVDLAITDLTITMDRSITVDFTNPFMNLGIGILYKTPQRLPPSLFSFMSPFSHQVWILMTLAYVGVSLLIYVMARLSAHEWTNPYPCIQEPEELESQFSLGNAFWFTMGALMQQGSEIAPISPSTRVVSSIWWFFTLIMVSTYTANLAAFLTVESLSYPIKNVEDLANQKVIKYGAKRGGSTANFFRNSSHPTYSKMWKQMEKWGDVFTDDNDEGLRRVKEENYAFFMESTTIEYVVERDCFVTKIDRELDAKGYGIALQKNSPLRHDFSTGVLRLAEMGKLQEMKRRWWKQKRGGGACWKVSGPGEVSKLGVDNVGGVFVVLISGCVVAIVACALELILTVRNISKRNRIAFRKELEAHVMFALSSKEAKPAQMTVPDDNCDETGSNMSLKGDRQQDGEIPRDIRKNDGDADYGFATVREKFTA